MTMLGVTPDMLHDSLLDNEPSCEDEGWVGLPDMQCQRPATWQYRMACGHPALVCDEHRHETLTTLGVTCDCGVDTDTEHLIWSRL